MLAFPPFQALFSTARALFDAALLAFREPAGLFVDFTVTDQTKAVLVRSGGVDTYYAPDAFFSNAGTSPKLVYDVTGTLVWSPHNLFLNSASPATQTVTTITGATYTVTVTGSGSLAMTSGGSGTASAGSPATFVATGTSTICTLTGSLTTIQMNRGSVATAYLATTSAARFGLAIDYDPTSHLARGLLEEAAATNGILRSQEFDNASWTKGACAVTANAAVAPDGTTTADLLIPDATSSANHRMFQAYTDTAASWAQSVFVKPGGYSKFALREESGTNAYATFNLSGAGSVVSVGAATGAIQQLPSGWYRVSMVYTGTAASHTIGLRAINNAYVSGDPSSYTFSGDAVSGVYVWQAQAELSSVATSPMPTFAATVTRARDLPNYLLSTIPSVATAVGMFAEFQQTSQESTITRVISLDDGTTDTRVFIAVTTSQFRGGVVVSTVAQATNDVGSTAVNTTQRAAFSATANDFRFAAGGVLSSPDASGTYPTVTTGRLGYDTQSQALVGGLYIRKFSIVPRILTDAELQAKST